MRLLSPGVRDVSWFVVWASIGGLFTAAFLSALTIGPFIVAVPVITTVIVLRVPNASAGRPGLISGASFPLLYVAFLNRHGPGSICNATRLRCHDEWSPWPWLLTGLGVSLTGATIFTWARRER